MAGTVYVTHQDYIRHTLSGHPENAGRIKRIWEVLDEAGIPDRMACITPRPATLEQVTAVHQQRLVDRVRAFASRGGGMIDPDTYIRARSYDIALLAAGGAVEAVDAVLSDDVDNALAVLRPPGHHATPRRAMGFCLFNNIAIAARHALADPAVERVMIVDYDVHHGNGTQEVFYDDPDVLFISTHQHPFYPGTGMLADTGAGEGRGTTINVPLRAGTGSAAFEAIYERIVWPAARRFRPDLILVSAGFDAHYADPLAMLQLDLRTFDHLARELIRMAAELCDGRIVFFVEGGYHLDALAYGVLNLAYALLGVQTFVDPLGDAGDPGYGADDLIAEVIDLHDLPQQEGQSTGGS
jgi:acetoin utilization deacetylase AcuC-like enzyme